MVEIYGIKNCNTVKKALDWLNYNHIEYIFHDFKKEPATLEKLQAWQQKVSWELLLNKKGTTWKKLSPEEQANVVDANTANIELIKNNSMIKRPVMEIKDTVIVGFDESVYTEKILGK